MRYWPLTAVLLAEAGDAASKSYVEAYIVKGPIWLWPVVIALAIVFVIVASVWLALRVLRRRAAAG